MKRGPTVLFALLAIAMGAASIVIGTEAQDLEDRLAAIQRDIAREQEAIHVLRAEWSHLNRPERIERLARKHLDLRPFDPAQTMPIADLPFAVQPEFADPEALFRPLLLEAREVSAKTGGVRQ